MKRLNRDTVTAVLLLLFCGLLFQQTFFVRKVPFSIMGSEVWPRVVLTALFILLLIYLFKSLITPPKNALEKRPLKVWLEMYRNPLWCFGMFFLFLISLPYFGMLLSGILFVFITQTIIGSEVQIKGRGMVKIRKDPRLARNMLAAALSVAMTLRVSIW